MLSTSSRVLCDAFDSRFRNCHIIVKLGSSSIVNAAGWFRSDTADMICRQLGLLINHGARATIVSSGAVALGRTQLNDMRANRRVAAELGQRSLFAAWKKVLDDHSLKADEVLVTSVSAQSNVERIIGADRRTVAVVNGDDVSAKEGDPLAANNDTLARFLAQRLKATHLILLTTTDGVLDCAGNRIAELSCHQPLTQLYFSKELSALGRGGMERKVIAAYGAQRAGTEVIIASAAEKEVILRAIAGESIGTRINRGSVMDRN